VKTIFLDRDGIVNKDLGYVFKKEDFIFNEGIFTITKDFLACGFEIIIITNQSGIGRGYYSEMEFRELNKWMLEKFNELGLRIKDVFYCPHQPSDNCSCRKPSPGMFLKAAKTYSIDIEKSWMIGDKLTDIEAANAALIPNTIYVSDEPYPLNSLKPTHIVSNLLECSDLVCKNESF